MLSLNDVSAAIISYHEKQLKEARANYSKIEYKWLHVGMPGLQACRLPEQACSGSVILSWTHPVIKAFIVLVRR